MNENKYLEQGEIIIDVDKQPVSQQSKNDKIEKLKTYIQQKIPDTKIFLMGDVQIEISWFVSQKTRYESVTAIDIDNIIKPLLDAISGIKGIIINDNQVKSLSCCWKDINSNDPEHIIIKIKYDPLDNVEKKGLFFVEYSKGFCFPVWETDPIGIRKERIGTYEKCLRYRYEREENGYSYSEAKIIMPSYRVFHRSRLKDFAIVSLEEIKNKLCIA